MIDKAITKITNEMMAINEPVIQAVEEYLTGICTNTTVAEKLLSEGKTLKELKEKIWNKAKSKKQGSSACLGSDEVFAMVEEYYGITEEDKKRTSRKTDDDVIDIMDLL